MPQKPVVIDQQLCPEVPGFLLEPIPAPEVLPQTYGDLRGYTLEVLHRLGQANANIEAVRRLLSQPEPRQNDGS